jgi:hypothetical protein
MEKIEDVILMGGWRCLCIGLLIQAVQNAEKDGKLMRFKGTRSLTGSGLDKELLNQRLQSRDWLAGGVGLITFEDCCEAMGVHPDRAREQILERSRMRKRVPEITEIKGEW